MIKRDILGTFKFNESFQLIAVEDYLFWLTLLDGHIKYAFLDSKLVLYRVLQGSITSRRDKFLGHIRHIYALTFYLIDNKNLLSKYRWKYVSALIMRLIRIIIPL